MSAIGAIAGQVERRSTLQDMLTAMSTRGEVETFAVLDAAVLSMGAAHFVWEAPTTPVIAGSVSVVADATLYYTDDLVRRAGVRGALPRDATAATLVAEAWRARGAAAIELLEGDFAFVLWDAAAGELIAARDFSGGRPLFYCWHGGVLRIASAISGILADPAVPRTIDLATLATVAAGLWSHSTASSYTAITELPAGHVLRWRPGNTPVLRRYWRPPETMATRRAPLDPAADELRALLTEAVRERLAPTGTTVVTLSGGWDSTAVYGVAEAIVGSGAAQRVHGVSISYPVGDPGREDEFIQEVTTRWGKSPDFIDVDSIGLLDHAESEAGRRDHPFAHTYEQWNRALSRRARATDARVVLDGFGGDQLFQVSDVYLAELFRTGQWLALADQLRQGVAPGLTLRQRFDAIVRPTLSPRLQRWVTRGGATPRHYLERRAPIWFNVPFLDAHQVRERDAAAQPTLPGGNLIVAESHAFLCFLFYQRIRALLCGFALQEGVALRSPLLDARVLAFAAQRPWSDRADGAETKRLLRRAVRDLLPANVLAPRPHRTGTTSAYFLRQLRRDGPSLMERVLPSMRLAEIGMVDPAMFRYAWTHVLAHDDDELAGRVFFTLQAELWMRGRTP